MLVQLLRSINAYMCSEFPTDEKHLASGLAGLTPYATATDFSSTSHASISSLSTNKIFKDSIIAHYVLLVGHMSATVKGDTLLDSLNIYETLEVIVDTYQDVAFMRLIVASCNYFVSMRARALLRRCLCMPYSSLTSRDHAEDHKCFKMYTLKLVANMFRVNNRVRLSAFFLDVVMSSMLTSEADVGVNNQAVVELGMALVEHFVASRPDLVDALLAEYNRLG